MIMKKSCPTCFSTLRLNGNCPNCGYKDDTHKPIRFVWKFIIGYAVFIFISYGLSLEIITMLLIGLLPVLLVPCIIRYVFKKRLPRKPAVIITVIQGIVLFLFALFFSIESGFSFLSMISIWDIVMLFVPYYIMSDEPLLPIISEETLFKIAYSCHKFMAVMNFIIFPYVVIILLVNKLFNYFIIIFLSALLWNILCPLIHMITSIPSMLIMYFYKENPPKIFCYFSLLLDVFILSLLGVIIFDYVIINRLATNVWVIIAMYLCGYYLATMIPQRILSTNIQVKNYEGISTPIMLCFGFFLLVIASIIKPDIAFWSKVLLVFIIPAISPIETTANYPEV